MLYCTALHFQPVLAKEATLPPRRSAPALRSTMCEYDMYALPEYVCPPRLCASSIDPRGNLVVRNTSATARTPSWEAKCSIAPAFPLQGPEMPGTPCIRHVRNLDSYCAGLCWYIPHTEDHTEQRFPDLRLVWGLALNIECTLRTKTAEYSMGWLQVYYSFDSILGANLLCFALSIVDNFHEQRSHSTHYNLMID